MVLISRGSHGPYGSDVGDNDYFLGAEFSTGWWQWKSPSELVPGRKYSTSTLHALYSLDFLHLVDEGRKIGDIFYPVGFHYADCLAGIMRTAPTEGDHTIAIFKS